MINPTKIIFYRTLLRFSQADLAKLINRDKSSITLWETGARNITLENKTALEDCFKRELEKHGAECSEALSTFNLDV